jgi:hypothetical protein
MLTFSAVVASALAPKYNSGYDGWWPGGYGYPPVTKHAHGYPCSVTAYGPTYKSNSAGWKQNYGGGTKCSVKAVRKKLTTYSQILGRDGNTWFTLTGTKFTVGPSSANPLRMIHNRAAFLGTPYRTVAVAKLVVPNGHAGCSLSHTCYQTITITATSRPLAP